MENIDLKITENTLTMKGEVKKIEEVKDEDYYTREIRCGASQGR